MVMEILEVFLATFAAGAIVAFLYGRKHQRWTNERRARGHSDEAHKSSTAAHGKSAAAKK